MQFLLVRTWDGFCENQNLRNFSQKYVEYAEPENEWMSKRRFGVRTFLLRSNILVTNSFKDILLISSYKCSQCYNQNQSLTFFFNSRQIEGHKVESFTTILSCFRCKTIKTNHVVRNINDSFDRITLNRFRSWWLP